MVVRESLENAITEYSQPTNNVFERLLWRKYSTVRFWHRVLIHPLELLAAKLPLALNNLYCLKADRGHRQQPTHSGQS